MGNRFLLALSLLSSLFYAPEVEIVFKISSLDACPLLRIRPGLKFEGDLIFYLPYIEAYFHEVCDLLLLEDNIPYTIDEAMRLLTVKITKLEKLDEVHRAYFVEGNLDLCFVRLELPKPHMRLVKDELIELGQKLLPSQLFKCKEEIAKWLPTIKGDEDLRDFIENL